MVSCLDGFMVIDPVRQLAPNREPTPAVGCGQVEAVGCMLVQVTHFLFWQVFMMWHVASKTFH